jgi:hypothetical protein
MTIGDLQSDRPFSIHDEMSYPMKRHLLAAFLSLFPTFIAYTTRGGEILYTFPNEVALQNGWNFYGSFTTDGKIGALSSADILNWSVDITNQCHPTRQRALIELRRPSP